MPRHWWSWSVAGGSVNVPVTEMGCGGDPVGGDGQSRSPRTTPGAAAWLTSEPGAGWIYIELINRRI